MYTEKNLQLDLLTYSWLPERLTRLKPELAAADRLLNDESLYPPPRRFFSADQGRPSIPLSTYLRLMFLKHRHDLGYEPLVELVADSIQWRIFCQLSLDDEVPDASTLEKLTAKFGDETIATLNNRLLEQLRQAGKLSGTRLRFDTTVVAANIHYPTDSSLLADCVRVISRQVQRLKARGVKAAAAVRNRWRSVKRLAQTISRRPKRSRPRLLKKMVRITRSVATAARQAARGAGRELRGQGKDALRRDVAAVKDTVAVANRIIAQTEKVLRGVTSIPNRLVSIFDRDARAIIRGKASRPVEFGYKILLQDNGPFITGYRVYVGSPADANLVTEVKEQHQRIFPRAPEEATGDRGFTSHDNRHFFRRWGVRKTALPHRGRATGWDRRRERQPWFRELMRFRNGSEGRISVFKRKFGGGLIRPRGRIGAATGVGWSVLAHNLSHAGADG